MNEKMTPKNREERRTADGSDKSPEIDVWHGKLEEKYVHNEACDGTGGKVYVRPGS